MSCRCHEALREGFVAQFLVMLRSTISLFQSTSQIFRISFRVKNCDNNNLWRRVAHGEVNRIIVPIRKSCSPGQPTDKPEARRFLRGFAHESTNLSCKSLTQSRLLRVIPICSLVEFLFCLGFNDHTAGHLRVGDRSSISLITSSKGRHCSGFERARSARRSNSSTCSGVKSESMPYLSSARFSSSWFSNS